MIQTLFISAVTLSLYEVSTRLVPLQQDGGILTAPEWYPTQLTYFELTFKPRDKKNSWPQVKAYLIALLLLAMLLRCSVKTCSE